MNIASPKQVQVDFYAHILDSNMFIFFKFDTVAVIIFHVRFALIAHISLKYRINHEDLREKSA